MTRCWWSCDDAAAARNFVSLLKIIWEICTENSACHRRRSICVLKIGAGLPISLIDLLDFLVRVDSALVHSFLFNEWKNHSRCRKLGRSIFFGLWDGWIVASEIKCGSCNAVEHLCCENSLRVFCRCKLINILFGYLIVRGHIAVMTTWQIISLFIEKSFFTT